MKAVLLAVLVLVPGLLGSFAAQADVATTPQPNPNYGPYPYPHPGPYDPAYPAPAYPPPMHPGPGYPPPYYPQPPMYPAPVVTCFAQGLGNGAFFFGVGYNIYAAQQWALYACNSSGQFCQITGCR